MIPLEHAEEQLQRAHLIALAAHARCNLILRGGTQGGDYGVDGEFRQVRQYTHGLSESGVTIDFQAKATKNVRMLKTEPIAAYDMDVDDYNKLVEVNNSRSSKSLLIVLRLPNEVDNWLEHSHDNLLLRHCCYWYVLSGNETTNGRTKAVRIPTTQCLSPQSLRDLLDRVERKESLI